MQGFYYHRNNGTRWQRIIGLNSLVLFTLFAGSLFAQPHVNPDRYRMMLQNQGRSDTTHGGGQAGTDLSQQNVEDALEGPVNPDEYVLGAGDVLLLTIWGNEYISTELAVMPEGDVNLPGIGDKRVAGITIRAAEDSIAKVVSPVYRNATVSLSLVRVRHFKVYCSSWPGSNELNISIADGTDLRCHRTCRRDDTTGQRVLAPHPGHSQRRDSRIRRFVSFLFVG